MRFYIIMLYYDIVLGLLSGGDSRAHQTSHFDCNPGASADPACVGHITALGYLEVCV